MATKKTTTKEPKEKKPKFKLVSYTLKATIPTGQYANIQPEITVEAESIEAAERAVMPYIESMFAKYRDGGVRRIEPAQPDKNQQVVKMVPIADHIGRNDRAAVDVPTPEPDSINLTVPYNRAKSAVESCTSVDALKLVSEQIEKSTKLIDTEKVDLKKLVTTKFNELNG